MKIKCGFGQLHYVFILFVKRIIHNNIVIKAEIDHLCDYPGGGNGSFS